jgi:hypothetical protein
MDASGQFFAVDCEIHAELASADLPGVHRGGGCSRCRCTGAGLAAGKVAGATGFQRAGTPEQAPYHRSVEALPGHPPGVFALKYLARVQRNRCNQIGCDP